MNSQNILSEFKDFCKKNLLDDLKQLEIRRKQAIISVSISGLIVGIIIFSLIQPFTKLILASYTPYDEVFIPLDFGFYTVSFSVSWYANLIIKLSVFSVYIILTFTFFLGWVLFYNSAFETFSSSFEYQTSDKIFQFIKTKKKIRLIKCLIGTKYI